MGIAPLVAGVGALLSRFIWPVAIVGGGLLVGPMLSRKLGINFESLKTSLLLGGAGVAAFAAAPLLPEGIRPVATIAGIAGLVGSAMVLFTPSAAAAEPGTPGVPPPGPAPFAPSPVAAVRAVQAEIVSPADGETLRSALFGEKAMPVAVRLFNPDRNAVTFNLQFTWEETPTMFGIERSPNRGFQTFQVTLGPGQQLNRTFDLPLQTSGLWNYVTVVLRMEKVRTVGETPILAAQRVFTFEKVVG